MIVVISDLHLQHTSCDVVRRSEGGKILETKVVRNVSGSALSLLFAEITDNAVRTVAREVHLVFAGDVFELHRTPLWLVGGETLRPTLHPASGSAALEAKVHSILDAIEHDNAGFFSVLSRFLETGVVVHHGEKQTLENAKIVVHYLPGNHDRLVNAWPSTRKRVRALLGIAAPPEDAAASFSHRLDWNRTAGYGVRVRHGHEYDVTNFSEPFDPAAPPSDLAYDAPALGDFVTVDLATRLAVAFRARYAQKLRAPGREGAALRRVYAAITEFDDVRPQSMLIHYLTDAVGASEDATFAMLRPVLRDAYETSMADAFFVERAKRLGFGRYFEGGAARLLEAALKDMSGSAVGELLSLMDKFHNDKKTQGPASWARKEPGLSTGDFTVIVAGHTHEPDHVAIPGTLPEGGPDTAAYFLDSGTWRTRIDAGVGSFGRLRGYTMVFCYHDEELRAGECRRFETWTGHLQAEDYGPMLDVDVTPQVLPATQTVRFTACRVEHVDEGGTTDGAELGLYFGVDGAGLDLAFERVHDGATLPFPDDVTLRVNPALDGELWCLATERDLGNSILDSDDPMPWAVRFLDRVSAEPGSAFVPGPITLRAADNRGNAFVITAEVL